MDNLRSSYIVYTYLPGEGVEKCVKKLRCDKTHILKQRWFRVLDIVVQQ